VAIAIASSMKDVAVRAEVVLIGEVGLSGELRWVGQMNARLREAAKLGFKTAIVPHKVGQGEPYPRGITIKEARSLREALSFALLSE
jgi:DNA repair protein RadA/Sms